MENTTGYSLSDIAAATGEGGFGNNGFIWVLLFAMIFGGGFGFGNRGGYNDYATAASQQDILYSSKFADLDNKVSSIGTALGNGIADSTFALNNTITSEGRNLQMQLAQVNANIDNKFAALEKSQLEQTIDGLRQQVSALNLNQAMCGVVRYPTSSTYAYSLPTASCGCNCGNV